jgi:hypothetical protein
MARRLVLALALLALPTTVRAQSLAPQTTWVNDHAQLAAFAVHRQEPANCTTIQAWTGFVRDGQLLVEYLAVATEGGRTGLIKGSDRYRRQ